MQQPANQSAGAAPAQPRPQQAADAAPAQPRPRQAADAAPAQPRQAADAAPAQPQPQPRQAADAAPAQPRQAAGAAPAQPRQAADAAPAQPQYSEQAQVRRAKRAAMLARGESPYPARLPLTSTIAEVRAQFEGLEAGSQTEAVVGVAGRVVFIRNTGKLCFATLQDGEGRRLQAMLSLAEVGPESLNRFKAEVDLGDHLFAHGRVIASKRGELSILADSWRIAAKALRPLPVLHADLSDEARVRDRAADLIVRPQARQMARARATVVRSVRRTLEDRGFVELETPILQTLHGGAAARPFTTHMNAFDVDLYLRIAPELFLKRAVVGGLERVFEIGRIFRNEGVDSSHAPEFTAVEAYQAYGDYLTMADLTERIVQDAARALTGSETVELPDAAQYSLAGPWRRISLYESLSLKLGEAITPDTPVARLRALADAHAVRYNPERATHGKLVEELFEDLVGARLYEPTFVLDFPVETSPLTRDHRQRAGVVEKWDLYVRGLELATAYSELVDPVVQRQRFQAQVAQAAAGDAEAMALDEDFLAAMEYGMPPAGGMGLGIDRLLMALTGLGVRETILFPLVKPLGPQA